MASYGIWTIVLNALHWPQNYTLGCTIQWHYATFNQNLKQYFAASALFCLLYITYSDCLFEEGSSFQEFNSEMLAGVCVCARAVWESERERERESLSKNK